MRVRDIEKEHLVKERACELLVREGFQGFSMNKLAKACGISVATLYIYYQDKEHLIRSIGVEIGRDYYEEMMKDFSPEMSFKEGLRKQWENRARYALANPMKVACHEIIRASGHNDFVTQEIMADMKLKLSSFVRLAIERKEIKPISKEVFWSIAYGPLYTLLRFNNEGKSMGGAQFRLTKKEIDEAFELVVKALMVA